MSRAAQVRTEEGTTVKPLLGEEPELVGKEREDGGDIHEAGVVGDEDVAAVRVEFVEALGGESVWTHAPCPWLNGDCNGDGGVTFADIDAFVALIGTTCP